MISDDERSHGAPVALVDVGDDLVPADLAIFRIERNQVGIGGGEVEPAFVHGDAAVADMVALGCDAVVMPDQVAGAGIDGPDVVGHGKIHDSIDQERRGFDLRGLIGLERPGQGRSPTFSGAI